MAAAAQRLEQLESYLDMTNVNKVKLPPLYIILQSLKPLCSRTSPKPSDRGTRFHGTFKRGFNRVHATFNRSKMKGGIEVLLRICTSLEKIESRAKHDQVSKGCHVA
jgi:hypothetical protein